MSDKKEEGTKNTQQVTGKIIGIDLGTTNSCVAVMEGSKPRIIESTEGNRTMPSIVAFTKDGEKLVGQAAKRQSVANPRDTLFAIKRLIGRSYKASSYMQKSLPYQLVERPNGDVWAKAGGKDYSPSQISAFILERLKETAEKNLGQTVDKAVITVPAYFNDAQRQATKDAGQIAGLDVVRIINEPTAAAMSYGISSNKDGEHVVVFDLGGGTFDVSILELSDGLFEVKSTAGDTLLGGEDFDRILLEDLAASFKKKEAIDLLSDPLALQRLREAAESAKIELSSVMETEINLPFITANQDGPKHFVEKVTRARLESLTSSFLQRTEEPCLKALKDAGLTKGDIGQVLLVGGQTRMPAVQAFVKEIFGKEPNISINPDEAVAAGAATQAGVLQGDVKDVLLLDVTPLSLGIETLGGVFSRLIERNTTIPCKKSQVFSTAEDNQPEVSIKVFQGEREMAADNKLLGQFNLSGIPPAPRGTPQISVTFDIDADGIVNVSASDQASGKEQNIRIQSSGGLTQDEIETMIKHAQESAEKDKENRMAAELRNQSDAFLHATRKVIEENKDKLEEALRKRVEEDLSKLEAALKDGIAYKDLEKLLKVTQQSASAIGQQIYAQKPSEDNAAPFSSKEEDGKNDDALDADFKKVDNNDKP